MTSRIETFLAHRGTGNWERLREDLREMRDQRAELLAALKDALPYATACIGLPRASWPTDSVILRAERIIERAEKTDG